MRKAYFLNLLILTTGCCIFFSSCETGSRENGNQEVTTTIDSANAQASKVKNILYSIPSPMEMADIIRESGSQYDSKILNPTDNAKKYTGEGKLALNLGIYGADLSYASMFDQRQESMNYLAAAQKLARDLGVDGTLQDNLIDRLNNNQENRDSLLNIVSQAYADLNDYLRENRREHVSALVIAGGWVEGLYLACYYSTVTTDPDLRQRIAEQRYSLKDLIALIQSYGNKPHLNDVLTDLNALKLMFDELNTKQEKVSTSKEADGTIVIGGGAGAVNMPDDLLKRITTKVNEIRSKYIS